MREIDNIAVNAKVDEKLMNNFISQYENFIIKCASSAAHSYISKSDDEWSIALHAFTEAIRNYSMEKGSFLNFAELVIRRRIIDLIRSRSRYSSEILTNPILFNSDMEEEEDYSLKKEISEKITETTTDNSLKLEIELSNDFHNLIT
jgi:RNA polymerase sigma factor